MADRIRWAVQRLIDWPCAGWLGTFALRPASSALDTNTQTGITSLDAIQRVTEIARLLDLVVALSYRLRYELFVQLRTYPVFVCLCVSMCDLWNVNVR